MATPAPNYATVVQELYVAYFGRPADPTGLTNFENALSAANAPTDAIALSAAYSSNSTIRSLIDMFGTSGESQRLYNGTTQAFGSLWRRTSLISVLPRERPAVTRGLALPGLRGRCCKQ